MLRGGTHPKKFFSTLTFLTFVFFIVVDIGLIVVAVFASPCFTEGSFSPSDYSTATSAICGLDDIFTYLMFCVVALVQKFAYISKFIRYKRDEAKRAQVDEQDEPLIQNDDQ